MNDRSEGNDGHENMCDDRSQNYLHTADVHAKANNNKKNNNSGAEKGSDIKTDRRSQETITVNG